MRERRRATIEDPSGAIECLPRATRIAVAAREERARREVGREPTQPREAHRTRPGDPNRVRELRSRLGWAWTRIVRTHDDYVRVLEHVAGGHDDAHGREPTAV